jgi:protein TonB
MVSRAQLRDGRITGRDYPRAAGGKQGTVRTQMAISATGRVTDCTVVRSSGNGALDATTCRLIRERFRFNPARDGEGRPMPDRQPWKQEWWRGGLPLE